LIKIRSGNGLVCDADEAVSLPDRMRGLMGRRLSGKEGLLMVFPHSGFHSIWMAGMLQPIDICFIDSQKKVANVARAAAPLSLNPLSWRIYLPRRPVEYVLELPPNSGIREGDALYWAKA